MYYLSYPVVIDLQGYRFEVYTLISEIHDTMDIVMRMKDVHKIEGVISTRVSCLHFLNRSILFSLRKGYFQTQRTKAQKMYVLFIDEISGLVMIKLLDLKTGCTNMIKVKFFRNT